MGEGPEPDQSWTPSDWPDDPVEVLARIYAMRQVADLGGFPHAPDWDRLEAEATARMSGRSVDPGIDLRPAPALADPMMAFVQVSAARVAADEAGIAHAPEWDRTEQAARTQLAHPSGSTPAPPAT